jgi:glycosyltransferase involved in cell wall biosynthesis
MDINLSLIIPSYNHAKYLTDLINSIFGGETCLGMMAPQELLPDEVIIADDCSIDNTEEVVFELSKLHREIKYVKLPKNSGTAIASNFAIENSHGKFITRIDSDDMRESFSFSNMMKAQLAYPHSYVYDDVMLFVNGQRKGKVWKMADYDFDSLLERNTNHAGIMFPRIAWEESKGYPPEFSDGRDDWAFNVALGVVGYCGIHIGGAGYLYRREQQNRTVKNATSEYQKLYHKKMHDHFESLYNGRFPMGCCGNRGVNKKMATTNKTSRDVSLSGAEGMTILLYNGENYGLEAYYGPITGVGYTFSVKKNLKNVDNRDLHTAKGNGLLDLHHNGKPVFSVYSQPAPVPVPAPVPELAQEQVLETSEQVLSSTPKAPPSDESHPIEAGQLRGFGKALVGKLSAVGITTWELFLSTDSASLAETLGKSVDDIEKIKKEITA